MEIIKLLLVKLDLSKMTQPVPQQNLYLLQFPQQRNMVETLFSKYGL